MWGVFSRHGLLLGQFATRAAAEIAAARWPQAVAVCWLRDVRIDR